MYIFVYWCFASSHFLYFTPVFARIFHSTCLIFEVFCTRWAWFYKKLTMQDFILLFVVVVAKISQHISGFYNHWNIFFFLESSSALLAGWACSDCNSTTFLSLFSNLKQNLPLPHPKCRVWTTWPASYIILTVTLYFRSPEMDAMAERVGCTVWCWLLPADYLWRFVNIYNFSSLSFSFLPSFPYTLGHASCKKCNCCLS